MNPVLADYIEAGGRLDEDDREIAVIALEQVDELAQREIEGHWKDEVIRRVDEIVNGEVTLVDSEETFAMAFELLAEWREK